MAKNFKSRQMVKILVIFFLLSQSLLFGQSINQKGLSITPIVDGGYPENYIQDFRVEYQDSGRCTDESFIELVTEGGWITLKPIKFRVSCDIISWGRLSSEKDLEILKNYPLLLVRIQNPQTDHVYYFIIEEKYELQKIIKDVYR